MGLITTSQRRTTNGERDESKSCLWEQEGGRKCQPSDGAYCRPCLADFKSEGTLPEKVRV